MKTLKTLGPGRQTSLLVNKGVCCKQPGLAKPLALVSLEGPREKERKKRKMSTMGISAKKDTALCLVFVVQIAFLHHLAPESFESVPEVPSSPSVLISVFSVNDILICLTLSTHLSLFCCVFCDLLHTQCYLPIV